MGPDGVTLAVIAKAPVPGRVKTRLCPPCTPEQAAGLAEAALRDTVDAVAGASVGRRVLVLDGATPDWLDPSLEVVGQRGGGLDERLAFAFDDLGGPTLVIGMDTPQVTAALLDRVVAGWLGSGRDAVVGPATDGGYWAIGLRGPEPRALLGVPMSTPRTGRAQRARLEELGLSVAWAPTLADVDSFDDAVEVAATCRGDRFPACVRGLAASLGVPVDGRAGAAAGGGGVSRTVIGTAGPAARGAATLMARDRRSTLVDDLTDRLESALPVIRDHAEATDRDAKFPTDSVAALADSGLLGLTVPAVAGGLGGSPRDLVDAVAAVAGACGSTSMVYLMHLSAAAVIAAAPPEGGDELLADLAAGTKLGTLAFSEQGSRSHFWAPVSTAEATGSGVRLRADKSWVTSASSADVYVASTRTAGATDPMQSDLYVVSRLADGVEVAGRFEGLGLRGNDSAPVRLDVEVDHGARLGDAGGGFGLMMQVVLPWFSLGNSAVTLGLARDALGRAIDHAGGARLEHLDSSLADLPTIRAYLAKAWTDLAAHDALLHATAASVAAPDDSTMLSVLTAKAGCNEAALRVTETALRVTGGAGFSRRVGIDRPYRDARAGFVMAPTSDALFDFAGRALCGLELF